MRGLRLFVASVMIGAALFAAGPASAAKPISLYYFEDCVGDGPTDFWAVKTATPPQSGHPVSAAAAFLLTDGTGSYSLVSFGEENFNPPGIIDPSESYNLVCTVSFGGETTTVYGVYTGR